MTDSHLGTPQTAAPTRRELRERERMSERAAMLAELAKQAVAHHVQSAEQARQDAVAEPAAAAQPAHPAPLSRREQRAAERAAEREEQLRAAAKRAEAAVRLDAHTVAIERNAPTAAAPVARAVEPVAVAPVAAEQVVVEQVSPAPVEPIVAAEPLEPIATPTAETPKLASVVSLAEARAARRAGSDLPQAPNDEPHVSAAFLNGEPGASGKLLPFRGRGSGAGRFSGSMVALSFLAGTAILGAGSATAIGALNAGSHTNDLSVSNLTEAQSVQQLRVADSAAEVTASRATETTQVTALGTATAANLAHGVKLPDPTTYTNDINANVQWPFPMGVKLTDPYGPRNGPAGTSPFHGGLDMTPGEGTPIGSVADGIVKTVDQGSTSLGAAVEVEHIIMGQRVTSLYAHLDPSTIKVKVGDTVHVGDEIAGVGNTGISTGPHLHIEIHVNGKYVNPVTFLTKLNVPGVDVQLPLSLGPTVIGNVDEKLPDPESTKFIDDLFVSRLEAAPSHED